jgi:phosphohistidine phosphatase SixA
MDIIYALLFVISQLFPIDPALSLLGRKQVQDMTLQLQQSKFINLFNPDVLICSPLQRAVDTCSAIHISNAVATITRHDLIEPSWYECIVRKTFETRIRKFESWLKETPYQRIVIVGHSQYFKSMIKSKEYMRNCDVWQIDYMYDEESDAYIWDNLQMKFRTELSNPHPLNRFFDDDFHLDL